MARQERYLTPGFGTHGPAPMACVPPKSPAAAYDSLGAFELSIGGVTRLDRDWHLAGDNALLHRCPSRLTARSLYFGVRKGCCVNCGSLAPQQERRPAKCNRKRLTARSPRSNSSPLFSAVRPPADGGGAPIGPSCAACGRR